MSFLLTPLLVLLAGCSDKPKNASPWDPDAVLEVGSYHLWLGAPGGADEVWCQHLDEPEEEHRVTVGSDGIARIRGLLSATTYRCEAQSGEGRVWIDLETEDPPEDTPEMDLTVQAGTMEGVYTVFNHLEKGSDPNHHKILIVDPDGEVRFYYKLPYRASGDIDVRFLEGGLMLYGGGYGGRPHIIDLDGEIRYQGSSSPLGGRYHHHVEMLNETDLLALVTADNQGGGHSFTGFSVEILNMDSGEVQWMWNSQRAVDDEALEPGPGDPYHANSVSVTEHEDGDRIWVSLRNSHRICRLVKETGELEWCLGRNTDFELVDATGRPLGNEDWFYHQHAPEIRPPRILLYDNGTARPGGNYSRVVEYELDEEAMTASLTWSWTEPGWEEPIWGDVDTLVDHLLITQAHCVDCILSQKDAHSSLIEIDRDSGEVQWRLELVGQSDGLYRAQRLGGCEIFNNARWCSE